MAEFRNEEDLRKWVQGKPKEVCAVLAARSALRAVPALAILARSEEIEDRFRLHDILPVFRGSAIAWTLIYYPSTQKVSSAISANVFFHAAAETKDSYSRPYYPNLSAARAVAHAVFSILGNSAASDASYVQSASLAVEAAVEATGTHVHATSLNVMAAEAAANAAVEAAYRTMWRALSMDATAIEGAVHPLDLAGSALWRSNLYRLGPSQAEESIPEWVNDLWPRLRSAMRINEGESWNVWIEWYEKLLFGQSSWSEAIATKVALLDDVEWKKGPAHVNGMIAGWLREEQKSSIEEPPTEPGVEVEVGQAGLALRVVSSSIVSDDESEQRKIHDRLKRFASTLSEATIKVGNQRPFLETIISEYADLVQAPFEELDVASLWAVGNGLLSNSWALDPERAKSTMAGPLEPDHYALLKQTAETHGGFILGFAKGRELTERADHSRQSAEAMESIVANAREVLQRLVETKGFVEEKTRKFLASIVASLIEPGWRMTRAGYVGYAVTRNSLIAIGKFLTWVNTNGGSIIGGIVLNQIDPGFQLTTQWLQVVLQHSQAMLAFAEPFPELKVWLAAQIDAAESDSRSRRS